MERIFTAVLNMTLFDAVTSVSVVRSPWKTAAALGTCVGLVFGTRPRSAPSQQEVDGEAAEPRGLTRLPACRACTATGSSRVANVRVVRAVSR